MKAIQEIINCLNKHSLLKKLNKTKLIYEKTNRTDNIN